MNFSSNKYTALSLAQKLGPEKVPSRDILNELIALGETKDFYLNDIHKKHYRALLDCETLDEAKAIYPEFKDVIDAKDIPPEERTKTMQRAQAGKIEGLTLENFTLELLKSRFARLASVTQDREAYFGLAKITVQNLFKTLNFPKIAHVYAVSAIGSDEEYVRKKREETLERWEKDDGTMRGAISSAMQKKWDEDDGTMRERSRDMAKNFLHSDEVQQKRLMSVTSEEYRAKRSQSMLQKWEQDDGTMKETCRNNALNYLQQQSVIDKRNQKLQSPEYRRAQSLAYDEETRKTMSQVAKRFPGMGKIIAKEIRGEELTEDEKRMRLKYFAACEKEMPNYHKRVGENFHRILVEMGYKKD